MLNVSPDMIRLGLSTAVVVARGVTGSSTPAALAEYRHAVARQLSAHWKNRSLSSDPVLHEYDRIHGFFAVVGEPAAPEKLLRYVRRHQDFAAAGPVVDCYNLVSAKTLLSIGAHDLAKLKTPITLRPVVSSDVFVPLGEREPKSCSGEYAYVDPDGRIICRMEVLQGDFTKVDATSRDVVFFLQGNREIPTYDLLTGAWLLAELTERFCGGAAEVVSFQEAVPGTAP
jgi:DNA/RNA-binding domain of Phe-tRNA-synthetase-like protein